MTEIMESQNVTSQKKLKQTLLESVGYEEQRNLPSVTHTYKDRIFRMIFKEKKEFLELYNAMNDSNYDNLEDLTVRTGDSGV